MNLFFFRPQQAQLTAHQLLEVKDHEDSTIGEYDFVTYPSAEGQSVYGVKVGADDDLAMTLIEPQAGFYHDSSKVLFTDRIVYTASMDEPLKVTAATLGKKQSDGSFRYISTPTSLESETKSVKLDYIRTVSEGVRVEIPLSAPEVSLSARLAVPEPRLLHSGLTLSHSGEKTQKFSYDDKEFEARYHSAVESASVDAPNAVPSLMDIVGNNNFSIRLNGAPMTQNEYVGQILSPASFLSDDYAAPQVELQSVVSNLNSTHRWSDDKRLASVEITDNAPSLTAFKATRYSLQYIGNNLIETLTVQLELSDAAAGNSIVGHNTDNSTFSHALPHGSASDFYLVEFYRGSTLVDSKIVSASELNGKSLTIVKDHGHWWEEQVDCVLADRMYSGLSAEVSYLYPFVLKAVPEESSSAPQRAASVTADGSVVKSTAAKRDVDIFGDIMTSVESLDATDEGSGEAEYYNMQGVRVSEPKSPGIYLRRTGNGRCSKRAIIRR